MQRVAFRLAGLLWLGLGILAVLTVFGTVVGLALAWLVGIRQSVTAARAGALLGVALFVPCQLIIDVTGCRHDPCDAGPYVLAYGLPALVIMLNLAAGWRSEPPRSVVPSRPVAPSHPVAPSQSGPGTDGAADVGAGI